LCNKYAKNVASLGANLVSTKMQIMKAMKNKVQLIGHLGANPEIKIFDENKKLAQLSLAVNDGFKNAEGEWQEDTQWFNLVAWSKLADYAEKNLLKGQELAIEGRLVNNSYTDKQDIKRTVTEIVLNEILLLGKQKSVKETE
jgi:single-strand DNA-binding protein